MAKIENGRQSLDTRSIRTISSIHIDDESSLGSDSEINGFTSERQTDKYGFIGGAQQYSEESAQDLPPEVLRQREVKWLDMLSHWDKWMIKRFNKVRLRCQKGIPPALRGRAWLYLSGGKVKKEQNQGKFEELDSQPGDPKWLDVIEKDLHRQFPFHEMFVSRGGHGQQDLLRVLKAYTLYRPEEGYCQAQAPIAAVLLMHMPAEDAFWGLVQICEKFLPGYYSPGLEAIQLDGEILFALLRRFCPLAYRHLEKHKIDPILYMTEWFMCAFSRTLPWASVLRVWDMFLCDGVKIIFRVGLVLLKCTLGTREKLKACQGLYETMEHLRAIDPRYMQEGFLVREILEVPVTARDVEREHHSQHKRWRKNRGELNFKPPPRMHGARLIMLAEPPRHQDLQQNPTIVLEVPTPQLKKDEKRKSKKKKSIKKSQPIEEILNPYPLPGEPPPPPSSTDPPAPPHTPPPAPPADGSVTPEIVPQTETNSPHEQRAPPSDLPPAKESVLHQSTQSLSSTEQDTYL
ncbi:TBC1 domain family member 10A-like [Melanotaenia boesemani]|uniref:TBC1 domain family member 10A-like n=1 Tax=Melanotaenia boesemani TaxID=1250792 RepID=UPI001C05DF9B|nr:TBC1 domain family member 10A-like [Melanotaenia boesemani]